MSRAIELMRAAQEKKNKRVQFKIPCDGHDIDAILYPVDKFRIQEMHEVVKEKKIAMYSDEGFDKRPINEKAWKKSLDDTADSMKKEGKTPEEIAEALRVLEDSKPQNKAEEKANKYSGLEVILNIIPQYLKDADGKLLFPTVEEQLEFREMMCVDTELLKVVSENFKKLSEGMVDEVKNSSQQES